MAVDEMPKLSSVKLFMEDVVQSMSHSSLIGMVSKVGGDSDSSSSSSDSEEDDEEEESEVCEGSVRVCWINTDESIEKVENIRVVDRSFLHGDVVASASQPLGQTGMVTNVTLGVDLEFPNGEVVTRVASQKLRRVRAFMPGDYVVHNQWLGRVDEVVDHVTVVFDDGAKCKVMRADPERLLPVLDSIADSGCPYYPGLRVRCSARCTSSSLFKGARWLRGSWKASRTEGVVVDVEAGSVLVYWIAAGNAWDKLQSFIPAEQQDPKGLVPLTHFSYANWQLGDRSLPPKGLRSRSGVLPVVEVLPSDGDGEAGLENDLPGATAAEGHDTALEGANTAGAFVGELQQDSWTGHRRKSRRCYAKREKKTSKKKDEIVESAALIVNTKTTVDVMWQDGTRSSNISACSLIPVDHLGDHDFWPEQYVLERGPDGEGIGTQGRRIGIIKSVDSKQRIAKVRWLKPVELPQEPHEFEAEETVSVYELIEHPDYNYCLADVVIRLAPDTAAHVIKKPLVDSDGGSSPAEDNLEQEGDDNETACSEKERMLKSTYQENKKFHSGCQDLSWVGVITGLEDGNIEVAWANGTVSKVGPHAIFVVSRDDDESSALTSESEEIVGEDGDDAASWETVDSTGIDELDQDDQLEQASWEENVLLEASSELGSECEKETQGVGMTYEHQTGDSTSTVNGNPLGKRQLRLEGPLTFPLTAIGFILRFAGSLFGLRGTKKISDGNDAQSSGNSLNCQGCANEEPVIAKDGRTSLKLNPSPHPSILTVSSIPSTSYLLDNAVESTDSQKDSCIFSPGSKATNSNENINTATSISVKMDFRPEFEESNLPSSEKVETLAVACSSFRHFDIVKDADDHHYFSETGQASSQRKWVKKIQQEWSILEKSLPDTIFVRVYEERMDLLRAVIIGAAGTPYHDGLFVFDFYLPPEYPSVPPVAFYHSGGLRLNPNLYENGKVCLSLLNTWAGKGLEVWNPTSSSILQVLVSIQGLVLNSKPYFNEAGYDRQVGTAEGEKNSLVYNENSFLLSCKSMIYLLRRPPKHFEELIRNHFKVRGSHILSTCKGYLYGTPVGTFPDALTTVLKDGDDSHDSCSEGFKLMLTKLVPRLEAAFAEVGVDCRDSYPNKTT